ncbi:MAG TPA: type II toxin-antitoxin system VapC family toxin [Streptosporangiaceae bacterium]|nr:type II toxin-antitoxin system VapC family toxin [Streptosporangiaceae bacterium]
MIIDTSALVAITFAEPGHQELIAKLTGATSAGIGTPTIAETGVVLAARLDRDSRDLVIRLLDEFGIEEVPFGDRHWREAVDAYLRFGNGRHRARLNFGNCLTYAVARLANEPLLFVGDDFRETDLETA